MTVRLMTAGQRDQLGEKMKVPIPADFTFEEAQRIVEAPKGAFEAEIVAVYAKRRIIVRSANALRPPFSGARLLGEPVPYVGPIVLGGFELLPFFRQGEPRIRIAEMVRRGREESSLVRTAAFGQRDLDDIWEMRKNIPAEDFLIGGWAFAIGDVWEDGAGLQYVEYVYRDSARDWSRDCHWFDRNVYTYDRLLRRK